ncbi:MAG: site-2 protease family protein [Lachnospiraceae bacterium]|nr:site-2 protease family protein [Lachnospiraceae bacterium]MBQ8318581.1 site-2 protease family protein [Lachnospiraceae bacterium]MBR3599420.1 site-2 protease family protein [Lachnospiraceae bacterium]
MNLILIILVFGVIVFFHEFGHFIVAKLNKIKVSEFSIGMGPAIFSFGKKETKYYLRLLPLGGYCLMLGEDEASEDENAFSNKPVWVRILVIAAGPVFNFILAFLFSIILINQVGCDPAVLYQVVEGGAAYEAGVEPGDKIVEINGDNIYNYRELTLHMELNGKHEPVELTIQKENGELYQVTLTPKLDSDGVYRIGVVGGYRLCDGIGENIKFAGYELRYWVKATITSLKMIVTGGVESEDVMGPVGVGGAMNDVIEEVKEESETTGEAVLNIFLNMLNWCILLSVNLGIMNLLPIPALDGGRLVLLLIEGITRKKIPEDKEAIINVIGFVLVIILMFVILSNDVKNLFFS